MCKFFVFSIFLFLVLPTVEGPHSDTLSRTRFSVFLRILFGVSSSSSSMSAAVKITWLQRQAPVIIFELYPPHDRPHTSDSLRASNDHMDIIIIILSPRLATFPSPPFGGNV